jgi:integrase/recombinase XerD
VERLITQFIRDRTILKSVSPKTVDWYRDSFMAFKGAMDTKASIVERIGQLRERGVSATSVNTYLRCVNAFHRWALNEGHLTGDMIHISRLKQEEKVLETLRVEQIKRMLNYRPRKVESDRRIYTLACLLLDTGLRIGEALSLTLEDVDIDNRLLKVRGKGAKQRLVPLSSEGRKMLWKWMTGRTDRYTPLVFATRSGTKPIYRNLLRQFKSFGKRLEINGVRFSFHTLRHTFAVNYIRNGGDVFRLQRVLGHSSLEMTRRYVNLQTEDLQVVHDKLSLLTR